MSKFQSTKLIELGSCAFRQPFATSHCSKIHGYQLKAKFWFGCDSLDEKNWVVDFAGLKELKAVLQHQFDHTTCIAANDPLLPMFQQLHAAGGCDLRVMENGVGIERTAEYCSAVADKLIRSMTNNRCWVEQVEVFEHELNSAVFVTSRAGIDATPERVAELLNEVANITSTAAVETPTQPALQQAPVKHAAHVGPNVSSGKGDWFKGTTWGN